MMRIQTAFGRAMYRKRLLDMITELLHTFLKLFLHMYFGNYFLHLYFKYCLYVHTIVSIHVFLNNIAMHAMLKHKNVALVLLCHVLAPAVSACWQRVLVGAPPSSSCKAL